MGRTLSRRAFGKVIIGGALALSAEKLAAEMLKLGGEPGTSSRFRRNIARLPASSPILTTFREAVRLMQTLPLTDPRNWTRQAEIHFNFCPHGNWFFLPWHRAYLFYFEEICRTLTGDTDFALPYWNWSLDGRIPPAFWGDSSNPLFDATRAATPADVADSSIVGQANLNSILNITDFQLFASGAAASLRPATSYGRLESEPHNYVHGFVGGNMGAFMSPLDPVFWTHHNMIECAWVDWNINRGNANTTDPTWLNFTIAGNFVQANGSPIDVTVAQTLLMPTLYRFEPCSPSDVAASMTDEEMEQAIQGLQAAAVPGAQAAEVIRMVESTIVSVNQPVSLPLDVNLDFLKQITAANSKARVILTIGDVTLPTASEFFVRVFVNHPDLTPTAAPSEPFYAGSFAFFVDARHAMHADVQPEHFVDLTETIQRLEIAENTETGALVIQLLAVPIDSDRELSTTSFALEYVAVGLLGVEEGPSLE